MEIMILSLQIVVIGVCLYCLVGSAMFIMNFSLMNAGQMLGSFMVTMLLLVASTYISVSFLDTMRFNSPQYQARKTERQQEEMKQLSAPVNIQPWGCFPGGRCDEKRSEAVALADSESIPEIGLNRVLVKRDSDEKQFAILLSGARNVKKGEKVRVVTATYWISANSEEELIIGK